jgi:hypothetical protein
MASVDLSQVVDQVTQIIRFRRLDNDRFPCEEIIQPT